MAYRIERKKHFEKELAALPAEVQRRVEEKIKKIAENPRSSQMKQLKGDEMGFSARAGRHYRIIYDVDDAEQLVTLLAVGHRREIYKR